MRKQIKGLGSSISGVFAALLIVSITLAASSANYRIDFYQIGAGGSEGSASANYYLASTIGQPVAGNTGSANYRANMGYRQPFNTPVPSNTPGGPTSTPAPTFTLIPTATTMPSNTPGGPTNTPRPTFTPRPSPTNGPSPTLCATPFVDIGSNVFRNAIIYLYCRGVVNGVDSTHYGPAGTSTRAQFAKVVVLGFGLTLYTPSTGPNFTDVPSNYFAYVYIETGYHYGVLNGFDVGTCTAIGATFPCYGPNRPITRAQLTKLVVNAANYPAFTPTTPTFVDVGPSNVFYASIETAHHKGVINGYPDNTFRPNNNIRRDEMAQIVYKGVVTPLE